MADSAAAAANGAKEEAAAGSWDAQLREYLHRIGLRGWRDAGAAADAARPLPPPTLGTLVAVHRAHATTIPFENLHFVHPRLKAETRPVDVEWLHDRIVRRGRGGMCQEMNALLLANLRALGFHAYQGLASVVTPGTVAPPAAPFEGVPSSTNMGRTQVVGGTHQIIFVRVGGVWYLCDVGFGGNALVQPIVLRAHDDPTPPPAAAALPPGHRVALAAGAPAGESHHAGIMCRLRRGVLGSVEPLSSADAAAHPEAESHVGFYYQALIKGAWEDIYYFTTTAVTSGLLAACALASFKAHPIFTKQLIVTMPYDDDGDDDGDEEDGDKSGGGKSSTGAGGRASLTDFRLKVRRTGRAPVDEVVEGEEARDAVLRDTFGINLVKVG